MTVKYPDVTVQLTGENGNAYAVIGAVFKAISRAHGLEAATAYKAEALQSVSYDALLQHAMDTVNID